MTAAVSPPAVSPTAMGPGSSTSAPAPERRSRPSWPATPVRARSASTRTSACSARPARLAGLPVELEQANLTDPLPAGPFDLVVSVLAIHHLEGSDKAALFTRIAGVLRPGGRFVLGDVVIPVDPADAVTPGLEGHDRPSTVADQLRWLADAGLNAAEVWSERDLVVLRADRPT